MGRKGRNQGAISMKRLRGEPAKEGGQVSRRRFHGEPWRSRPTRPLLARIQDITVFRHGLPRLSSVLVSHGEKLMSMLSLLAVSLMAVVEPALSTMPTWRSRRA